MRASLSALKIIYSQLSLSSHIKYQLNNAKRFMDKAPSGHTLFQNASMSIKLKWCYNFGDGKMSKNKIIIFYPKRMATFTFIVYFMYLTMGNFVDFSLWCFFHLFFTFVSAVTLWIIRLLGDEGKKIFYKKKKFPFLFNKVKNLW